VTASIAVGEALLILKILFLLLLYVFIWRIVRTASRDLRLPQESFVLAPQQAASLLGGSQTTKTGRLVFPGGEEHLLDSRALTIGRGSQNDIALDGDDFASARHARLEPRRDGSRRATSSEWARPTSASSDDCRSRAARSRGGNSRFPPRAPFPKPARTSATVGSRARHVGRGGGIFEVRRGRPMSLSQRAAVTDPGRRRRRNEDSYVMEPPLFAVADGMGGAQAGEIASRIAASVLRDSTGHEGEEAVVTLIQEANRRVYEAAATDEARSGMGTTMTVALVENGTVRIGHVGDSRAYLIRDGRLEQLTEDHSLVAELVRSGRLSREEADVHPQRSVITRVLGTDPYVDVDTFSVESQPGDLFMLCSDGLTSMVDDETILGIVEKTRANLERAARALVDAANKGGGEDNITVVAFEIGAVDVEETATLPAVGGEEADDEPTLSGLDAVPVIEDADSGTADESVTVPRTVTTERRLISRAAIVAVSLGGLAILVALGVGTLSRSYFVGAQPDGHVAVYPGLPWDIVGRVRLYRVRYESPVLAGQLSQTERRRLFDHDLRSYDTALGAVRRYETEVVP